MDLKLPWLFKWQFPAYHALRRLTLVLATLLVYGTLFIPLHFFWGDGISLLSVVPAWISGWYFGSTTGLFTSLIVMLFNFGLWYLIGQISVVNGEFLAWAGINLIACGLAGYISGQVSESRRGPQQRRGQVETADSNQQKWASGAPVDIEATVSEIVDFMPDAMLVANRKGQIIVWNTAMESLTHIRSEDILGKTISNVSAQILGEGHHLLIDYTLGTPGNLARECPGARWEDKDLLLETFFSDFKPGGAYLSQKTRPIYNLDGIQVGAVGENFDLQVGQPRHRRVRGGRQVRGSAHRLPAFRPAVTDSHFVACILRAGCETSRCHTTAWNASVCGVIAWGASGGTITQASATLAV